LKLKPIRVSPERLLLDPNNYRFLDIEGYKRVISRRRFGDAQVQEKTLNLLQNTPEFELQALIESIRTNGYVALEQIVVEEYDKVGGLSRYLVIEGNRRVAAVKTILQDVAGGNVTMPSHLQKTLVELPALQPEGTKEERKNFQQTLMAIRHVAGIRAWGPYQQAKLIAELYEQEPVPFGVIAQRVGIDAREVGRRYRAFKALQQMEADDEYGKLAQPRLYAYFQEALSAPLVREWLGWNDKTFMAENADARTSFYDMLIIRHIDGQTYPAKLKDIRQVRRLKDLITRPTALSILRDPERSFDEALAAALAEEAESLPGVLAETIKQAIRLLNRPGIDTWVRATEAERGLWQNLLNTIDNIKTILSRQ
jgi:hypothetical protein